MLDVAPRRVLSESMHKMHVSESHRLRHWHQNVSCVV